MVSLARKGVATERSDGAKVYTVLADGFFLHFSRQHFPYSFFA
jgi:hypothetical protein